MGPLFLCITACAAGNNNIDSSDSQAIKALLSSLSITSLSADFVSTRRRDGVDVEVRKGFWAFQLQPFPRHKISFKEYHEGALVSEQEAVWDSETGIGKSKLWTSSSISRSGVIAPKPPNILSNAALPSNPGFFFRSDRAIRRYFDLRPLEIIPQKEHNRLCLCQRSEDGLKLTAFVVDTRRAQLFMEQRSYIKDSAEIPAMLRDGHWRHDLGEHVSLPGDWSNALLFSNKIVIESRDVGDKWIPIKWKVLHSRGRDEFIIELQESTITLDPQDVVWDVEFPSGSEIHDSIQGIGYSVGDDDKRFKIELLSEADLDNVLEAAGIMDAGARSTARDAKVPTGCGANVLYLALAMRHTPVALETIIQALGIGEGQPLTNFDKILQVTEREGERGVSCAGYEEALRPERRQPVILQQARTKRTAEEADWHTHLHEHFYLIDDYDDTTATVRVFDPPHLPYRKPVEQIITTWTGKAILFDQQIINALIEKRDRRSLWSVLWITLCVTSTAAWLIVYRYGRKRQLPGTLLLLLTCVGVGCRGDSDGVTVNGKAEVDLGNVDGTKDVTHIFSLTNNTNETIKISDVRRTCSCTDFALSSKAMEPGEQIQVTVKLDTTLFWGKKGAAVLVNFEQDGIPEIALKLEAFVKRDYAVQIHPLYWTIEEDNGDRRCHRKTFRVKEILSRRIKEDEVTKVFLERDHNNVRLVSVGPWKLIGELNQGFGREAELTLEIDAASEAKPADQKVALVFERKEPGQSTAASAHILLRRL